MNKFKKLLLEFPHTSSLIEIWVSRLLIISLLSVSFSTTILNGYIHFVRQTNVSIKERKKPFKPLKKDKKKKNLHNTFIATVVLKHHTIPHQEVFGEVKPRDHVFRKQKKRRHVGSRSRVSSLAKILTWGKTKDWLAVLVELTVLVHLLLIKPWRFSHGIICLITYIYPLYRGFHLKMISTRRQIQLLNPHILNNFSYLMNIVALNSPLLRPIESSASTFSTDPRM